MKQTSIIIDACSLLNLSSSDIVLFALRDLGEKVLLLPTVADEVLYIYRGGKGPDARDKVAVNLEELVKKGALVPDVFRSKEEEALFVELTEQLDDGEAACCAVAISRRLMLLTDDRQAIKLMSARGLSDHLITTPDVVKRISEALDLDGPSVRRILVDIQERSRFVPSKQHPLTGWWETCVRAE